MGIDFFFFKKINIAVNDCRINLKKVLNTIINDYDIIVQILI